MAYLVTMKSLICLLQTYYNNDALKKFYKVLSTNRDKEGVKEFVSTIEGNDVNLWKVQCYGAILLSQLSSWTIPSLWEFYFWSKLSSQNIQILHSYSMHA